MAKFTLTLSENERFLLLMALGQAQGNTAFMANKDEEAAYAEQLAARVINLSADLVAPVDNPATHIQATAPAPGTVPVSAGAIHRNSTPGHPPREYWAKNAKREKAESLEFEPIKIERKDTAKANRLVILAKFAGRNLQASCWEEDLFGIIATRARQKTLFYVTRNGNYINVIGLVAA